MKRGFTFIYLLAESCDETLFADLATRLRAEDTETKSKPRGYMGWSGPGPLRCLLQDLAASSDVEDGAVKASAIAMARRLLDSTD